MTHLDETTGELSGPGSWLCCCSVGSRVSASGNQAGCTRHTLALLAACGSVPIKKEIQLSKKDGGNSQDCGKFVHAHIPPRACATVLS